MGFGDTAYVLAGHVVVLLAAIVFIVRMVPMAADARRAEVGYSALSVFPTSAMLLVIMGLLEALYYGAARILINHGINLWEEAAAVGILRLMMAASVYWHAPAWLRWRGYCEDRIRWRIAAEVTGLILIWIGAVLVFQ